MFPVTSWLLEAMRAPTPVSCLVHSSTLVAAGVWFCFRYGSYFSDSTLKVLSYLRLYTIILTGFSALFLTDLKKLVALSTCNNISWCVFCFTLGDSTLGLLFLITHGISKCLLFIVVGDLMSSSSGSQSGVGVYSSRYSGLQIPITSVVLLSSLSGLPYMGVFLVKHILMELVITTHDSLLNTIACLCVVLTYCYTYRFGYLLMDRCSGISFGVSCEYFLYMLVGFTPRLLAMYAAGDILVETVYSDIPSFTSLFFIIHFCGMLFALVFHFFLSYLFKFSI